TQFEPFQRVATTLFATVIVGVMILAALQRAMQQKSEDAILHMAGTLLAVLYLGGLAWFLIALRVKSGALFVGSTSHVLMILLGALLESMFKRDADVKDSGSLLPGFGGVLDVIDSPLLAAPFAYFLFSLFTR